MNAAKQIKLNDSRRAAARLNAPKIAVGQTVERIPLFLADTAKYIGRAFTVTKILDGGYKGCCEISDGKNPSFIVALSNVEAI